jgi:hypothetical protein
VLHFRGKNGKSKKEKGNKEDIQEAQEALSLVVWQPSIEDCPFVYTAKECPGVTASFLS